MGSVSWRERVLGVLVLGAIVLWVIGGSFIDPTLVAFVALSLMLVLGVVTWGDMARNHSAWTTIMLLATLVTLTDGLSRAGFVKWFADYTAAHVVGLTPTLILMSHGDDADDAGGGACRARPVRHRAGDGSGAHHRPDRDPDAVRDRCRAALLQQQLPDAGAVLGAWGHLRGDLPGRPAVCRVTVATRVTRMLPW